MDGFPLLWLLPIATFVIVIAFAIISKRRAETASGNKTSPLARATPDPNLRPDPKVTDPEGVTRS